MYPLHREVLPNNLTSREEAEVLVSLDRAVLRKCEMWNDAFVRLLVDFAVWASRPTGKIDREMATWLVTTLGAGAGPTQNGINAAFEIVREAQQVDDVLTAFVMNGVRNKPVRVVAPMSVNRWIGSLTDRAPGPWPMTMSSS